MLALFVTGDGSVGFKESGSLSFLQIVCSPLQHVESGAPGSIYSIGCEGIGKGCSFPTRRKVETSR